MCSITLIVDISEPTSIYKMQFDDLMRRFKEKHVIITCDEEYLFTDLLHIAIHTTANNLMWTDNAGGPALLYKYIDGSTTPYISQDCNFNDFTCYLSEAEIVVDDGDLTSMGEHLLMELASMMVSWTDDILKRILANVISTDMGRAYFDTNTRSDILTTIEHSLVCPIRERNDVVVMIRFNGT